jgi:hypothetical protein
MTVYARNITPEQSDWLQRYEDETGFEAMYQDQLDDGEMTFEEVASDNLRWFSDWVIEVVQALDDYPRDDE